MRALSLVVLLCACGGSHSQFRERANAASAPVSDDPSVRAAQARFRAASHHASQPQGFEEMQLRVQDLSRDEVGGPDGVTLRARVPIPNPWESRRIRQSREHRVEAALADVELTSVRARAELCTRVVDYTASTAARELQDTYAAKMREVLTWADRVAEAGVLDVLQAAELTLEIRRRLAGLREPPPIDDEPPGSGTLMSLDAPTGELQRSTESLRTYFENGHPAMNLHLAEARSYRSLAQRERARVAPWFDFVEVLFRTGQGAGAVETRLAFNIPLAVRPRQAAGRYEALADAEEYEAEASVAQLRREAGRALAALAHYEERLETLADLNRHADQAMAIADRAQEAGVGDPSAVSDLYAEIFASRSLVLSARRDASLAECDLLMATGLTAREWPRD